jgi:hypothetical protein
VECGVKSRGQVEVVSTPTPVSRWIFREISYALGISQVERIFVGGFDEISGVGMRFT